MPTSKGVSFWSALQSRLYQPIVNQPEDSYICSACEKPACSRPASSLPARLHFLAVALGYIGLFIGGYALFELSGRRHDSRLQDQFIPTPTFSRIFLQDPRFVNSDPHDGFWNFDGNFLEPSTPWDEIFPGAWIEISHPAKYGLKGGLPMNKFYYDNVSPESEAYVPSVFHQIHCVGEIKHAFIQLQQGRALPAHEHIDHCIEYLRQAVMCSGDLTLERPSYIGDTTWTRPNGWGVKHQCRDLSNLYSFPQANFSSVVFSSAG